MNDTKDIRKNWQNIKLGELCLKKEGLRRGPFGSAIKKEFFVPDGYKVYEQSNAIYDDINRGRYFIDEAKYNELKAFNVIPGDLIVSCSGTLGKISEIPKNANPGVINQALLRIRLIDEIINKKYFLYFFRSAKFQRKIFDQSQGTAMSNLIGIKDFKEIILTLPPLNEQEEIVIKIEELLSELEHGKQQLQTAQQQLKVYRQSIMKWAFEGKLTNKNITGDKLPRDWKWVKNKELLKYVTSGSRDWKQFYSTKGSRFVRTQDINSNKLNIENAAFVDLPDKVEGKRSLIEEGDILMTITGAYVGKVAVIDFPIQDAYVSQSVALLKYQDKRISKYMWYYFQATGFGKTFIEKLVYGVGRPVLSLENMREVDVLWCPLEDQQQIIDELESKLVVCDKIEETISQSLEQTEALKQSILKMAFEGKLFNSNETTIIQNEEVRVLPTISEEFPRKVLSIAATDLQAGIIAMIIQAHENSQKHRDKLNHVKCEKISDLVERKLGISLGRVAMKDAAGPDDFPHLKKVEHRAKMAGFFAQVPLQPIGHTYKSERNMQQAISKVKGVLSENDQLEINKLIETFLPFELEHAELIATLYAGWNNLLILGKVPTDEEIVYESRENWSKRKLTIPRENFFKTLEWMKTHYYVPEGKGQLVLKKEEVKKKHRKGS